MRRFLLPPGLVVAAGACSLASPTDSMENAIRESLAAQGEVLEVEMTEQDANRMTGNARVRNSNGDERRMDCSAERAQGDNFSWTCIPAVDEVAIREVENAIRRQLATQGTVEEVSLERRDADSMAGFARVRDAAGNEVRTECTATRDTSNNANFGFRCGPGDQPAGDK